MPPYARALDILRTMRVGDTFNVHLCDGTIRVVHNIAWGYDVGETVAHITTNISPEPNCPHEIDFFLADEIDRIVDAETGGVRFVCDDERAN
ncbi:hypothetical protein CA54_35200 [Symmachiella macrocystis]|uniref:Uncharacterized protein n=1 Tax=Symmachiella macrocystis TaxID=2527985 RepID=A0A5C6BT69_9PLAN|nr:hypothetical protein CA54_35200 [Symmachiella macrocystis]